MITFIIIIPWINGQAVKIHSRVWLVATMPEDHGDRDAFVVQRTSLALLISDQPKDDGIAKWDAGYDCCRALNLDRMASRCCPLEVSCC